MFDVLSAEQVAHLTDICEAIIAHADSPVGPGLGCPTACDGDDETDG
jgi:hypothetical protein